MKSEISIALCLSVFALLVLSTTMTEALPRCRPGAMLCRPGSGRRDVIEKPNQDVKDAKDKRETLLRKRQPGEDLDIDYSTQGTEDRTLRKLRRFLDSRY